MIASSTACRSVTGGSPSVMPCATPLIATSSACFSSRIGMPRIRQTSANCPARLRHSPFQRADRYSQHTGDFQVVKFATLRQEERITQLGRQLLNLLPNSISEFRRLVRGARIRLAAPKQFRAARIGTTTKPGDDRLATDESAVPSDRHEPRPKRRLTPEFGKPGPRTHERILSYLLRVLGVPQGRQSHPIDGPLIPHDEVTKGPRVPLTGTQDQILVRHVLNRPTGGIWVGSGVATPLA